MTCLGNFNIYIRMNYHKIKKETIFILHGVLTFGAFFIPFLISWQIAVPILALTVVQHIIYGRCLLLSQHGVSEEDGSTFFSDFFERLGFKPNKKAIRFFTRKILYSLLAFITLIWQVWLGHEALWF